MLPRSIADDQFYCDFCNKCININDKDNHINGYNLRQKEEKNKNEKEFECNVKLTNDTFHKIHIGSKKHRTCRECGFKKPGNSKICEPINEIDSNVQFSVKLENGKPSELLYKEKDIEANFYKSTKEKYRSNRTQNREEIYQTYLHSLLAYWGVILALNPKVEDFKISVNNKEWGKFGDVVLEIDYYASDYEEGIKIINAIRLKYISNKTKQFDDINKGKFNLTKLVEHAMCLSRPKKDEIIKYIIYTTADSSPNFQPKIQIKGELFHTKNHFDNNIDYIDIFGRSLNKHDMINTVDDKDNAFILFSTDKNHPLPKLYLYCGQEKLKHFGSRIDAALSKCFGFDQVEISTKIICFIQYWTEDRLGDTYKLNKEHILAKIGDILLSPHQAEIEVESFEAKYDFSAWNQAVNAVDITILHNHPFIIRKICKPINLYLEENYKFLIDPNNKQIAIPQDQLQISNKALAMYLFEETIDTGYSNVPLFSIYRAFWKAGLGPLILEALQDNERESIFQIITVLKKLGLTRKYIINLQKPKFEHIFGTLKYLTYFLSLDDIINKLSPSILDKLKIQVSEHFFLNLTLIQTNDEYFFRNITANDFFDISLGKFSLKQFNDVVDTEIEWKLVLNDKLIKQIKVEFGNEQENEENCQTKYLSGIDPKVF